MYISDIILQNEDLFHSGILENIFTRVSIYRCSVDSFCANVWYNEGDKSLESVVLQTENSILKLIFPD